MTGVNFIAVAGFSYLLAMVFYTGFIFFRKRIAGCIATFLVSAGVALHLIGFFLRWRSFYHINGGSFFGSVPITNLYESLQFFALLLMIVYLIFQFKTKNMAVGAFASAVAGATVLFIDAVGASGTISPLVPALQSNWLLAHVTLSFIAYVFFAISAITAFLYLVMVSRKRTQAFYIFWTMVMGLAASGLFALIFDGVIAYFNGNFSQFRLFSATLRNNITVVKLLFLFLTGIIVFLSWYYGLWIKNLFSSFNLSLDKLDSWTYKFCVTGFAIFTIGGLIFGAIWAEQAWGRYWSWDPKETWAFITWITYGVYLHGRLYRKWRPTLANSLALVGFILTIFTYIGVNLFLSGLHSYGSL